MRKEIITRDELQLLRNFAEVEYDHLPAGLDPRFPRLTKIILKVVEELQETKNKQENLPQSEGAYWSNYFDEMAKDQNNGGPKKRERLARWEEYYKLATANYLASGAARIDISEFVSRYAKQIADRMLAHYEFMEAKIMNPQPDQ